MSAEPLREQLVDTWRIHQRINLYVLDAVAPEALADALPTNGRNAWKQLVHVHNVRLMWLDAAAKDLAEGVAKLDGDAAPDHAALRAALAASGAAVERLLARGLEEGRIKGFKPHPAAFLGYLIAHEAHHRSQVIVALKAGGHPIDKKVGFGMWEWGVR